MLIPGGDLEGDGHLRVERRGAAGGEVGPGGERDAVDARLELRAAPVAGQPQAPVAVGLPLAGRRPSAPAAVVVTALQPDLDTRGGASGRRVEDVRGQRHRFSSFVIRSRVIFSSSARTTPRSASWLFSSLARSWASISWPDRPLAQIRKIWPNRCS